MLFNKTPENEPLAQEAPAEAASPRPPFGMAFGGGGMKAWAHLGVLEVLERYGLRPDVMAGCSSGALVAAYYAAGFSLQDLKSLMQEHRTSALFSLRFDGVGLLSAEDFREFLTGHLGDLQLEDLETPLNIICTDLDSGREVVLSQGPIVDALIATTAIPGLFSPVRLRGRLLIDGGLTNNVPVSALVNRGARYTIAVRLHEGVTALARPPQRRMKGQNGGALTMWAQRLARSLRPDESVPGGLEIFGRSLDIVIAQLEGYRLQAYHPDILITPQVGHVGTLSITEDPKAIYDLGVMAAEEQAEELERLADLLNAEEEAS